VLSKDQASASTNRKSAAEQDRSVENSGGVVSRGEVVDKKVKASKDGKQAERVRRAGVAAIPIGILQVLRSDGSTVDSD
jgi:hypothetical protein